MAGKKGQKKRFWSDEEKRSICMQTQVSNVSVAQVARRYAMNANLIHKWLKDPQFTPNREDDDAVMDAATFLPLEIESAMSSPIGASPPLSPLATDGPLLAHRVDITLSDGRRILVEGSTALSSVLGLIKGLIT